MAGTTLNKCYGHPFQFFLKIKDPVVEIWPFVTHEH